MFKNYLLKMALSVLVGFSSLSFPMAGFTAEKQVIAAGGQIFAEMGKRVSPTTEESLNLQPWLELRLLADLPQRCYLKVQGKDGRTFYAAPESIVDPRGIADVVLEDGGNKGVALSLTKALARQFEDFTAHHRGRRLGIFVNGELVSAPVVREAIPGPVLTLQDVFTPKQAEDFVRAWSAPVDTSLGKRSVHIQGLGDVMVQLEGAAPGRVQFFLDGSIYNLPLSFVSRTGTEIPPAKQHLIRISLKKDTIGVPGRDLKDVDTLEQFLKANAKSGQLLLIEVKETEAADWPKKRKDSFTKIIRYAYDSPYVGLRQEMPPGWKYPKKK